MSVDDRQADPPPAVENGRQVREARGWRRLALATLACLARLWCRTLRLRPDAEARRLLADPRPTVFVLWHNRLFAIAEVHRRFRRPHTARPIHGLISASRDGALLAAFFQRVGIRAIRGSSSWRGAQAVREASRALEEGDLGVTPDGPRGPRYDFKPGAALLARKANCPVALLGLNYRRAWRLRSWDGFYLPWPFSHVEIIGRACEVKPQQAIRETAHELRAGLLALTRDHDD